MIQNSLNKHFNSPNIPKYYFFVLNFGTLKTKSFIRLKNVTCLSGPNGAGKSSLMDAVKTAIIGNKQYLTFNPKGANKVELRDYLNLYGKYEKKGPTLLVFSVDFPDKSRGYKTAIFGIGWDKDINGKFFYKEMMTREQALPLIKNSISTGSFFKNLELSDYPGKFFPLKGPIEYHRFLDEVGIFFFFPKNYENLKYYRRFLNLLKNCAKTLTSTEIIDTEVLKRNLFQPNRDTNELKIIFDKIERGLKSFADYHKDRVSQEKRLASLEDLLEKYRYFYKNYEMSVLADKLNKFEDNTEKIKNNIKILEADKNKIENEVEILKKKIANTDQDLEILKIRRAKLEKLDKECEKCDQYYSKNENIFKLNPAIAQKEISDLEKKIEDLNKTLQNDTATCKRRKTITENKRKELDEFKEKRKEQLTLKERYERELKDVEVNKNIMKNDLIFYNDIIKKNNDTKQELSEYYLNIEGKINSNKKNDISSWFKIKSEEIKELTEKHENYKECIDKINQYNVELDSEKNEDFILKKFDIQKLYTYFNNFSYLELKKYETILRIYRDYYVVPSSKESKIPEIIDFAKEINQEVKLILLKSSEEPKDLCKIDYDKDEKLTAKILGSRLIIHTKLIEPLYFGKEQRNKSLSKYENELRNINDDINNMKDFLKEIKNIYTIIEFLEEKVKKNEAKIKEQGGYESLNRKIEKLIEKLDDFEKEKSDKHLELSKIPTNDEYKFNLNKLKSDIKDNEKHYNSWKDNVKKAINNLKELQNLKNEKQEQIDKLPSLRSEWNSLFLNCIHNSIDILEIKTKEMGESDLNKLFYIKKKISSEKEQLVEEITQKNENIKHLKSENEDNEKNILQIRNKLEESKKNLNNLWNEKENYKKETKKKIKIKLIDDINSNLEGYDTWFEDWLENLKNKIKNTFFNKEIETKILNEWNNAFEDVCSKFSLKRDSIQCFDGEYKPDIKSILDRLNYDNKSIDAHKYLINKIRDMDDKLDSICKDFVSNITSFLDLIVSEIRSFKRTVKKYNVIAKNASFGSLNQIIIEIENDRQYDALRDFKNNLDNALNEGTLNAKIFDIINKGMFSLSEYFSREILNDPHARSRDFLDIYQYFDFEIYSQSEGIKRPALSSSGGESTGIKFLIYALAFHNLRSIEGYGDLTYQKPVFIYFDEAAAVDPSGIKTIIEISEKLKVNAIIAMVDAPAIHNKKVIDYIMANGVINTGYSDMIAEIESGKID